MEEIVLFDEPPAGYVSSRYCLSMMLKEPFAQKRYEIVAEMNRRGVGTSVYYPRPVPNMTYYAEKYGYKPGAFPNAGWISDASIALPVGPHLDEEDMHYISTTIKQVFGAFK